MPAVARIGDAVADARCARPREWPLVATAWLYLTGAPALLTPLEAAYPAFADEELPTAEAIVVLGGAITGESRFGQGGDINQAADRLWRAATLYQSQKAPLLVLSGGTTLPGGLPESQLMAEKLSALGIPEAALIQEPESRTTRENAQYTQALLEGQRINHILLVTSASHMRRASAVFAAQGFIVTAVSTDHQIPLLVGPIPGWLPTAERLSRSTRAIHEWVIPSLLMAWVFRHSEALGCTSAAKYRVA